MYYQKGIFAALFLFTTALLAVSCTHHKEVTADRQFAVTDSLVDRLLIDTVGPANSRSELTFSAKITENEERRSEIFPMVSGVLQTVAVKLGDHVNKGQTLATLSSSEMAGFDKEVIAASAEVQNAQRNLTQAQQLYESGLSSQKEAEQAKNNYDIARAELKRASSVLKLNGGSNTGLYTIKSPVSGFVTEKNAASNMQLRGDYEKSLFTVADLSNVWAMINVYESDISSIKEGDPVSISILSYPDKVFTGRIDRMYNIIDQDSKVMNARVVISNPGYLLKPGMLATVKVSASSGADLPVVNSRAVIFDDNKNYVLLVDDKKKIHIQQVEIGRKTADKIYISKGVTAGDRVVSSRQVFLFESLKK